MCLRVRQEIEPLKKYGNQYEVTKPELIIELKELKKQIEWLELKERLHLRLISSANDELARRGEQINKLIKTKSL